MNYCNRNEELSELDRELDEFDSEFPNHEWQRHGAFPATSEGRFEEVDTSLAGEGASGDPFDWLKKEYDWATGGASTPPPLLQTSLPAVVQHITPAIERLKARAVVPREKVCWMQVILNKTLGEQLVTDGLYGPLTRQAVRKFQQRSKLAPDGIVGPRTETALIQSALNQIAQASVVPINGVMDEATRNAVKRFQASRNLTTDGKVGPNTRAAMVTSLGGRCIVPPSTKIEKQKLPPTCDQADLSRRLEQCRKDYWRCLAVIGAIPIIEKVKGLASTFPACAKAIATESLPAILECAYKAGIVDIDTIFKMKQKYEDCSRGLDICRHGARANTRCL